MDIRELDRRAMAVTATILPKIAADRLDDPTPCGEWRVRDLLAHIVGQYHGFALAASGEPTEIADFRLRPVGPDFVAEYMRAAELVTEAFADDAVPDRKLFLAEIRDGGPFPATIAIGFHLVDEVVHAWDLAVSVGLPVDLDHEFGDDVLDAALAITQQVPDTPETRGPGSAFAPGIETSPEASKLDRILAMLGRRPDWTPST